MAEAIVRYLVSPHALEQLRRRGLALSLLVDVLTSPEQRAALSPGRDVLQSLATIDGRR